MKKFLLLFLFIFSQACATNTALLPEHTPNGISVKSLGYPVDYNFVDFIFIRTIEQTVQQYGGNEQRIFNTLSQIKVEFIPLPIFLVDIINGKFLVATGDMYDDGRMHVSLRDVDSQTQRPAKKIYCTISHEFVHWVAQKVDARELGDSHSFPFYGPKSINENVCRTIEGMI